MLPNCASVAYVRVSAGVSISSAARRTSSVSPGATMAESARSTGGEFVFDTNTPIDCCAVFPYGSVAFTTISYEAPPCDSDGVHSSSPAFVSVGTGESGSPGTRAPYADIANTASSSSVVIWCLFASFSSNVTLAADLNSGASWSATSMVRFCRAALLPARSVHV